jgi:hypothetical protein
VRYLIWLYVFFRGRILHEQILFDKFHMSKYFAWKDDKFVTNLLWQMHLNKSQQSSFWSNEICQVIVLVYKRGLRTRHSKHAVLRTQLRNKISKGDNVCVRPYYSPALGVLLEWYACLFHVTSPQQLRYTTVSLYKCAITSEPKMEDVTKTD